MDPRALVRQARSLVPGRAGRPRYLFVVTYGRSGSTLVQGLLNALPRTLIRGENNLYILPLFNAWLQVRGFQRQHAGEAKKGVRSAFYGLDEVRLDDFVRTSRELVTRQLYGSVRRSSVDVLGFKEVLWHRIPPRQTETFFVFFEQVFPGARYVLNRRDHDQVSTSGFWRTQERSQVLTALERVESIQDFLRETRAGRTHDTRYEDLAGGDPAVVDRQLRALAGFALGRCDEAILGDLRATMGVGYGPNPFGQSRLGTGGSTPT